MKFTFSKEIVNKYFIEGYGYFNKCKVYKVFENEKQLGQFFRLNNICFFNYNGKSVRIHIEQNFFKKSKYILIDQQTQFEIGKYIISGWAGKIGRVILQQDNYICEKVRPDIRFSLFKKDTWGRYKVQLSNGINAVVYQFKIDRPFISTINTELRPFTGEIELWGNNILLLFAGLFLLERVFEIEDTSSG